MEIQYKENGILVNGEEILLNDIINKCNEAKIKSQNLVILKIEWQGGRGSDGQLEKRTYPKETAEQIVDLILNKEVNFGEIAGKHSEVYGTIDREDVEIIEGEQVEYFLKLNPTGVDYNYSFIDTLTEYYEDNGGREYWEESQGEDYCDDIEELIKIS